MSQVLLEKYGLQPKAPEVIDSSMLKDFMDCPSKFYLRHVLGLRPKILSPKIQAKFDWGTCWHDVLFHYYRADADPVTALEALERSYPVYITPETDRYKRSKDRMIQQFFEYHERWQKRADEFEILRHEQYFDVYSDKVDLRWCGRIDSLRRVVRNDKIRVWDYKTSSAMGPTYFDQHELGFQFPGYVWAAQQMFTDEVKEITVDVMYTISKSHDFFMRTFRYDEIRTAEWISNVKMILDRMGHLLENHLWEPSKWEKNWNECTRYGYCQFFPTHALNPRGDSRLRDLQDNYIVDRWDPSDMGDEEDDS